MFTKESTINFSCTQCGECCKKPPHMNFYDIFNLSNDFFIQTAHNGIISYEKKPLEKELLNHYQAIGNTILMDEIDAAMFYYIDFTPVNYSRYKTCSKLENNICTIYNNRPSSCKIAPLDYRFEDSSQWRTLNFYKNKVDSGKWKCDFSDNSPIIYSQEQIYNPHYNSAYFQSVDIIRDFTDYYIQFISLRGDSYKNNHLKSLFNSIVRNDLMISDMIISLQVGRYHNIISEELALTFMENQIRLIEKESSISLSLKIKDDLKISRLYKKQKEDYIRAIKNNIFSSEYNNIEIY